MIVKKNLFSSWKAFLYHRAASVASDKSESKYFRSPGSACLTPPWLDVYSLPPSSWSSIAFHNGFWPWSFSVFFFLGKDLKCQVFISGIFPLSYLWTLFFSLFILNTNNTHWGLLLTSHVYTQHYRHMKIFANSILFYVTFSTTLTLMCVLIQILWLFMHLSIFSSCLSSRLTLYFIVSTLHILWTSVSFLALFLGAIRLHPLCGNRDLPVLCLCCWGTACHNVWHQLFWLLSFPSLPICSAQLLSCILSEDGSCEGKSTVYWRETYLWRQQGDGNLTILDPVHSASSGLLRSHWALQKCLCTSTIL